LDQLAHEYLPTPIAHMIAPLLPPLAAPRLWVFLAFNILTQ
jgi:hypothetical protein